MFVFFVNGDTRCALSSVFADGSRCLLTLSEEEDKVDVE
jgi:hypothetical protein